MKDSFRVSSFVSTPCGCSLVHWCSCPGPVCRTVVCLKEPIELEFKSKHCSSLLMQVHPTGSKWESLDDWVLPSFSYGVLAKASGGTSSHLLSLERAGAVVTCVRSCRCTKIAWSSDAHKASHASHKTLANFRSVRMFCVFVRDCCSNAKRV